MYFNNNNYAALAETADTHNYLYDAATEYFNTTNPALGTNIKVANGKIISPKAQTQVNLSPHLSKDAQHRYIFNDLSTGSLISIG